MFQLRQSTEKPIFYAKKELRKKSLIKESESGSEEREKEKKN